MNLNLIRHAYLPDVTLGWLYAGALRLATLEEPWNADPDGPGGQRQENGLAASCIPDGIYDLRPHVSEHYPLGVWAFVNTSLGVWAPGMRPAGQKWGRDAVLLHPGNSVDDIEGCVVAGRKHAYDQPPRTRHIVLDSRNSIVELRTILGTNESHTIRIRPSAGTNEV